MIVTTVIRLGIVERDGMVFGKVVGMAVGMESGIGLGDNMYGNYMEKAERTGQDCVY